MPNTGFTQLKLRETSVIRHFSPTSTIFLDENFNFHQRKLKPKINFYQKFSVEEHGFNRNFLVARFLYILQFIDVVVNLKDFYKSLSNTKTKIYKRFIILVGLLFLLLILMLNKFNVFSIVIGILSLFMFFKYRNKPKIVEKLNTILLLLLLFKVVVITEHPLVSAFFVIMCLVYLNLYFITNPIHKLKLESIVVIALTIVLLQISHPIFKPRIDIISIDNVYQGFVYNEKPYGIQYYTLSILPPLVPPSCTDIILGYDVLGVFTDEYRFGVSIKQKEDGTTEFCTPFFDFTKRIVRLKVFSLQPVYFEISDKNLTRFWWISQDNNKTRISQTTFYNKNNFPLTFSGNVSYFINNNTLLDYNKNLLEYFIKDTKKMECRLKSFRLSSSRDYASGIYGNHTIINDTIMLTFPVQLYLLPYNYTNNYIQFDPYACDN